MSKQFEATISGRVQMVMYRDFAQRNARRLGITGTVQNLKDGTVRVVAQGNEKRLQQFIALLHKGSLFSQVAKVELLWVESKKEFEGFNIIY